MQKRKRGTQVIIRSEKESSPDIDNIDGGAIFRQYFERQYEPLEESQKVVKRYPETAQKASSDAESQSDWEGLSGDESSSSVEVVQYGASVATREPTPDVPCRKSFMSAKPPNSETFQKVAKEEQTEADPSAEEETATEATNLKHDVELQRLLKESHLLERSSGSSLNHVNRHKAMDLRLQSLGAKSSLFAQAKMPLSHRRGIIAKAKHRDSLRRQEAKENGIVLAKEAKTGVGKSTRRERGIGGPSIGKFKGGTLQLSSKDIGRIQGPRSIHKAARKHRA